MTDTLRSVARAFSDERTPWHELAGALVEDLCGGTGSSGGVVHDARDARDARVAHDARDAVFVQSLPPVPPLLPSDSEGHAGAIVCVSSRGAVGACLDRWRAAMPAAAVHGLLRAAGIVRYGLAYPPLHCLVLHLEADSVLRYVVEFCVPTYAALCAAVAERREKPLGTRSSKSDIDSHRAYMRNLHAAALVGEHLFRLFASSDADCTRRGPAGWEVRHNYDEHRCTMRSFEILTGSDAAGARRASDATVAAAMSFEAEEHSDSDDDDDDAEWHDAARPTCVVLQAEFWPKMIN